MKVYFFIIFTCLTYCAQAQTDAEIWKNWNKNYPNENVPALLKFERQYAASVEGNPKIAPYYVRMASYRFKATFLGKAQPIDVGTLRSMQRVFTLNQRDPNQVALLVDSVVLIKVGLQRIWMPIQKHLLPQLRKEVAKGSRLTLYCAFLNEHTTKNKLFNNFLISEFIPGKGEDK